MNITEKHTTIFQNLWRYVLVPYVKDSQEKKYDIFEQHGGGYHFMFMFDDHDTIVKKC